MTTPPGSKVIAREREGDLDRGRDEPSHARFIWMATAVLIAGLWIRPLFSGLWLDETGTWWVIKDGWSDAIDRAIRYQGQSPLYYAIAWLARRSFGSAEAAIRVPSLLAFTGATVLVYRLARHLCDREVARLAVLVLSGSVAAFAAADARPYATALLCIVGTASCLVAWLDQGRHRWGVAYAIVAALTVWAHFFFVLGLIAIVPYALVRIKRGSTSIAPWHLGMAWLGTIVLIVPLFGQIASLRSRSSTLMIHEVPAPTDLVFSMISPFVAVTAVLALGLVTSSSARPSVELRQAESSTAALLLPWAFVPPGILLGLSLVSTIRFVPPRYWFAAAPAAGILGGYALACLGPAAARRIAAVVFAILAILAFGSPLRGGEDWRGATDVVRAVSDGSTVILAHPGFIESTQVEWLRDPERSSYLLAPFSYYEVPGVLIPMPHGMGTPEEHRYVEELAEERLRQLDRFLLVTRDPFVPFQSWLDGRLGDDGWTWRSLGTFGIIEVFEFTKRGALN